MDSLLRWAYERVEQGAAFGHSKVRSYPRAAARASALIATISTTSPHQGGGTRLCSGNTGSARGAASLAAEALTAARAVPAMGGTLMQMAEIRSG